MLQILGDLSLCCKATCSILDSCLHIYIYIFFIFLNICVNWRQMRTLYTAASPLRDAASARLSETDWTRGRCAGGSDDFKDSDLEFRSGWVWNPSRLRRSVDTEPSPGAWQPLCEERKLKIKKNTKEVIEQKNKAESIPFSLQLLSFRLAPHRRPTGEKNSAERVLLITC